MQRTTRLQPVTPAVPVYLRILFLFCRARLVFYQDHVVCMKCALVIRIGDAHPGVAVDGGRYSRKVETLEWGGSEKDGNRIN